MGRGAAGTSGLRTLGHYWEFAVLRNLRVVRAKAQGVAMHALAQRGLLKSRARTSVYGVKLAANYGDKTFRYCLYGTYGTHLSRVLEAQDTPFVFVDIGANQGLFSAIAATNPACEAIIAFEPVPATHALLSENLALNGANGRATPLMAALSDNEGELTIGYQPGHSGVASLTAQRRDTLDSRLTIRTVTVAALDAVLPPDLPIIVKIDVEGHEETVIAQLLQSAHADRIEAVFYEADERWSDAAAMRDKLAAAGFGSFTKLGIRRHYDMLAQR
ncbi:conserved hypothetical protein [Erythrobacter sp. EC-HK427]|nr:conserved hypothetical protein [Erythrobacter sp. EC-HK427]